MMTDTADGRALGEHPRPKPAKAVTFLVFGSLLTLFEFVLIVTLAAAGIATIVVWIGIPILIATTTLVRGFGNLERRWVRTMLGTPLPDIERMPAEGRMLTRWRRRLVDPTTWRDLGYLLLKVPLSVVELAAGLASVVLLPLALWVAPWVAWVRGSLALALLGPNRAERLAVKAQHLQASRARGVDAAEAERRRIERDLHDGAQQRLVSVAMSLGRARNKLSNDPAGARELIDEAHNDAKLAVSELRDLARGIYPAVLADRGLDAALSAQAAKCPVPVNVWVDVEPRPPAAVETTAYFIVGETLTNITKHSRAGRAEVKVWRSEEKVILEIVDDGQGGAELRPGGGLAGLADRAATIDGVITVVSPLGGPTVVRADLPCTW